MILAEVEIYNRPRRRFEKLEAIVDTGSTLCVIEKSLSVRLGLPQQEIKHLWQMAGPLNAPATTLRLRFMGKVYVVRGLIVEIKPSHKQWVSEDEKCTRPEPPHPLTNALVLGKSFLDQLPAPLHRSLFSQ